MINMKIEMNLRFKVVAKGKFGIRIPIRLLRIYNVWFFALQNTNGRWYTYFVFHAEKLRKENSFRIL